MGTFFWFTQYDCFVDLLNRLITSLLLNASLKNGRVPNAAATSAGTQNPNEHRCRMVGRWGIRCSVGWLRIWLSAPFCQGGGPACCGAVVRPCAGYPACLILLVLYQRLLVFFYNNRIGPFNGLSMGLQLSSSKFEIEFLFLGASISNLVYLFSLSLSSNLITFFLCIIYN